MKRKLQASDVEWKRECIPRTEKTTLIDNTTSTKQQDVEMEYIYGGSVSRIVRYYVHAFNQTKRFNCTLIGDDAKAKVLADAYLAQLKLERAPKTTKAKVLRESFWNVEMCTKTISTRKNFTDAVYGSSEKAEKAAELYRRQQSDILGQTTSRILDVPDDFRRYTAGFCDGDGCITANLRCSGITAHIALSQSRNDGIPSVISRLQAYYGGQVGRKERRNNVRASWLLSICGQKSLKIVIDLSKFCVLKHQQAQIVLDCLRAQAAGNISYDFRNAHTQLRVLKKKYKDTPIQADRMTVPYLAGFFDAEGCIFISDLQLKASITKRSCHRLLQTIVAFLNQFGITSCVDSSKSSVTLFGAEVDKFAKLILPYSIVKKDQLQLGIEFRKLHVDGDESNRRKEIDLEMRRLKRL